VKPRGTDSSFSEAEGGKSMSFQKPVSQETGFRRVNFRKN
jgi:hypothetical protein